MRRLMLAVALAAALVIPATATAEDPTTIPGWTDVSGATQAYWLDKLRGDFSNVGNPDPAEFLAQWLYHQKHGIVGTSLTAQDLEIGVAFAKAYAAKAGVTPAQLAAAQALIVERGGIEGSVGYEPLVAGAYFLAHAGLAPGTPLPTNAAAYIAALRAQGDALFPSAPGGTGITYRQVADQLAKNWGLAPVAAASRIAPSAVTRLRTYIARLTACACNPVKLALYRARLDLYLAR